MTEYYQEHKEEIKAKARLFYQKNRDKILANQKAKRKTNYPLHKDTILAKNRANRAKNKERWTITAPDYQLKKKYRIAYEQATKYTGLCDICKNPSRTGKRLNLDHCHTTGNFRGWLCHGCNLALGFVNDSPELLEEMAQYLRKSKIVP